MNKLPLFLFCMLKLVLLDPALGCSCDWEGPFLEMAKESDLVAKIKVLEYQEMMEIYEDSIPNVMIVEIVEIFKGKEERKQVKVWGDNGFLCRPYLSIFQVGSEWILNLNKGEKSLEGEAEEDYSLLICGENWLALEEGMLKGVIFPKNVSRIRSAGDEEIKLHVQELSLSAFREEFEY